MERKIKATVTLSWPIDLGEGKQLSELTVARPRGRLIKRVIALLGPDFIKAGLAGAKDGAEKIKTSELVIEQLANFATVEKLDELTEVIAILVGQPAAIVEDIDPEDYPALFGALAGFFPSLFSGGEA